MAYEINIHNDAIGDGTSSGALYLSEQEARDLYEADRVGLYAGYTIELVDLTTNTVIAEHTESHAN